MNRVVFTGLWMILAACSSNPSKKEKGWVDNFVDSGEFNRKAIIDSGLLYLGSENTKYSNISEDNVNLIDVQLLNIVVGKYGADTVLVKGGEFSSEPRFKLSYVIRDNRVTKSKDRNDGEVCDSISRKVEVDLSVVDSLSLKKVWGGTVEKSLTDSACNLMSKAESDGFLELLVESVIGAAFHTYPETPKVTSLTEVIFSVYEGNLP